MTFSEPVRQLPKPQRESRSTVATWPHTWQQLPTIGDSNRSDDVIAGDRPAKQLRILMTKCVKVDGLSITRLPHQRQTVDVWRKGMIPISPIPGSL